MRTMDNYMMIDMRRRRAESLTASIMQELDGFIERDARRGVYERLMTLLYREGA